MTVRAKLKCTGRTENCYGGDYKSVTLEFTSQYDNTIPEDQRFQMATPSASAKFQIDNPAAATKFELGKDYYVDFTPAS